MSKKERHGRKFGRLTAWLVAAVAATSAAAAVGAIACWVLPVRNSGRNVLRRATGLSVRNEEVVDAVVLEGEAPASSGLPRPLTPAAEMRAALLALLDGRNRGAQATAEEADEVRRLADGLAEEAKKEGRWRLRFPDDLPVLDGRWRLLYSSAFAPLTGTRNIFGFRVPTLGGLRPGPPLESPALEVGNIYQRYRTNVSRADTIVQLRPPRWFRDMGFLEKLPFATGNSDTVLTLTQGYDVASEDTLRFAFVDGEIDTRVLEVLQPFRFPMTIPLPFLQPDTSRDGLFTDTLITTYCDGELRIGVGGRFGELRVFLKG